MAVRIEHAVVRGEIDNRTKGVVFGSIWIHGASGPLRLELTGNAWPDLAGSLLKFSNPGKTFCLSDDLPLGAVQCGAAGDLTASCKVRVPDVPVDKFYDARKAKEVVPEQLGNCLYLEWFSADGRVLIEGVNWDLEISPPEWQLTPEENEQRAKDATAAMARFLQKLTDAIDRQKRDQKDPDAEWDEHDYERFLRESDARTAKYGELLDKYGDSDEAEAKIDEEMGWNQPVQGNYVAESDRISVEEMNRILEEAANEPPPEPDPDREGIDWIRTEDGDLRHPLQHRCFESAMKFWRLSDEAGLRESEDKDLQQFVFEFQTTSAKLAGALAGIPDGAAFRDGSFTVAYLKRALGHLHKAQAGLEAIAPKKLLPESSIAEARRELFEIREGILRLMDEYRGR